MTGPDYAGLRAWLPNPSSGDHVGVYDGEAAGMDTEAGRWQTVCEAHGTIISHRTLALALYQAEAPDEWCEACRG